MDVVPDFDAFLFRYFYLQRYLPQLEDSSPDPNKDSVWKATDHLIHMQSATIVTSGAVHNGKL